MRRWHPLLALVVMLALGSYLPLWAQEAGSYSWQRYDVEINLRPDGTFDVSETQVLDVRRPLRKSSREIPLDRVGGITEIAVEEPGRPYVRGSDQPFTFATTLNDGLTRIDWWFPQIDSGTRTFFIRYRVDRGIGLHDDGDQLYWTAVSADHPTPVGASTVTVRFPTDLAPDEIELSTYPEGAAQDAGLADPRTVVFNATSLLPGEPFEIRVQFPHGLVQARRPPWQLRADLADWYQAHARAVLNVVLVLAALFSGAVGGRWLLGVWRTRVRGPSAQAVPRILDRPPSDRPAAMVGMLVNGRADSQEIVASLLDLADREVLRLSDGPDPRFELLKNDVLGLRPHERTLLATLFPSGLGIVQLSDVRERAPANMPLFEDQLRAELAQVGLFERNLDQLSRRYRSIGTAFLIVGAVGVAIAAFALLGYSELWALPFVALALIGGAARGLAHAISPLTTDGALEAARWRAFARHLQGRPGRPGLSEPDRWLRYEVALRVGRDRETSAWCTEEPYEPASGRTSSAPSSAGHG